MSAAKSRGKTLQEADAQERRSEAGEVLVRLRDCRRPGQWVVSWEGVETAAQVRPCSFVGLCRSFNVIFTFVESHQKTFKMRLL